MNQDSGQVDNQLFVRLERKSKRGKAWHGMAGDHKSTLCAEPISYFGSNKLGSKIVELLYRPAWPNPTCHACARNHPLTRPKHSRT